MSNTSREVARPLTDKSLATRKPAILIRDKIIAVIEKDADANYPRLRESLVRLQAHADSAEDRIAASRLEEALKSANAAKISTDRTLHFRMPLRFQRGYECLCSESDQVLHIDSARRSGQDLVFRFHIQPAIADAVAEVQISDIESVPLVAELESGELVWRPKDPIDSTESKEFAISSLSQVAGQIDLRVRLIADDICIGEIISVDGDEVVCWLEIREGLRIKSSLDRRLFSDVAVCAGQSFRWSISRNSISSCDLNRSELLDEINRLDKEWDEELKYLGRDEGTPR